MAGLGEPVHAEVPLDARFPRVLVDAGVVRIGAGERRSVRADRIAGAGLLRGPAQRIVRQRCTGLRAELDRLGRGAVGPLQRARQQPPVQGGVRRERIGADHDPAEQLDDGAVGVGDAERPCADRLSRQHRLWLRNERERRAFSVRACRTCFEDHAASRRPADIRRCRREVVAGSRVGRRDECPVGELDGDVVPDGDLVRTAAMRLSELLEEDGDVADFEMGGGDVQLADQLPWLVGDADVARPAERRSRDLERVVGTCAPSPAERAVDVHVGAGQTGTAGEHVVRGRGGLVVHAPVHCLGVRESAVPQQSAVTATNPDAARVEEPGVERCEHGRRCSVGRAYRYPQPGGRSDDRLTGGYGGKPEPRDR